MLLGPIAIGWTVPNKEVLQAGLPVQIGCSLKIGWRMAFDVMILMVVLLYDILTINRTVTAGSGIMYNA